MKYILMLTILFSQLSCNNKKDDNKTVSKSIPVTDSLPVHDSAKVLVKIDTANEPVKAADTIPINAHPPDGSYRYALVFAEFQNKTLGEKVTVTIKGDSIKIVYEGDGKLTAARGSVLEEGIIRQHKSGAWIIAHNKKDAELEVIGGCSGGPQVIDFNRKRFITC